MAKRPAPLAPPFRLSGNPPVPEPEEGEAGLAEHGGPEGPEPTRYGDWEAGGIARDF
ncbi:MAG: DUF1674 domain-containing protein [Sphingomonadaceae bacterium]